MGFGGAGGRTAGGGSGGQHRREEVRVEGAPAKTLVVGVHWLGDRAAIPRAIRLEKGRVPRDVVEIGAVGEQLAGRDVSAR